MGVFIRDMKMPPDCEFCGFARFYTSNQNIWCNAKNEIIKRGRKAKDRPEWCPLEEMKEEDKK